MSVGCSFILCILMRNEVLVDDSMHEALILELRRTRERAGTTLGRIICISALFRHANTTTNDVFILN